MPASPTCGVSLDLCFQIENLSLFSISAFYSFLDFDLRSISQIPILLLPFSALFSLSSKPKLLDNPSFPPLCSFFDLNFQEQKASLQIKR